MELDDRRVEYADPEVRHRLRPLRLGGAGPQAADAVEQAARRQPPATSAETDLMKRKGWDALGAFDPDERSRALDLLGFESQLVFSTFAATQFEGDDVRLLYG